MPDPQSFRTQLMEFDEQSERIRWFYASRTGPQRTVFRGLIARASAQRLRMALQQRRFPAVAPGGPGSVNWTPLGPSVVAHGQASGHPTVSGRVTALAVGPAGQRVYLGSANGGVWFSQD